jgi:hypothetical protein
MVSAAWHAKSRALLTFAGAVRRIRPETVNPGISKQQMPLIIKRSCRLGEPYLHDLIER